MAEREHIEQCLLEVYNIVKPTLEQDPASKPAGWKLMKSGTVDVWSRPSPTGFKLSAPQFRSRGNLTITASQAVVNVLEGGENRETWNPVHDNSNIYDEWESKEGWHCRTFHEKHRAFAGNLISPRDFIKASARFTEGDAWWFLYCSVNPEEVGKANEADAKPQTGFARALAGPSGSRATPIIGKDNTCEVNTVLQADPSGWIPGWLVNKVLIL